ncbi:hypothetical protein B0H16DRAFT_169908 [Mycena metata]|uniref:Uncharacterized protein n=1 Tax=Mycena metata TaxID=1033252 RepID=A0AAD7JV91_9AGAR|nr:hypothetical protein B0H16DRAFT_169908 [Mycena metata]
MLLLGNGAVTEVGVVARLELSVLWVALGPAVSVILMALTLPTLLLQGNDDDPPIDGTGILHTIWLYRNHPELDTLLEQVEEPTTDNLRVAGMLRTRLVDPKFSKQTPDKQTYSSERGAV